MPDTEDETRIEELEASIEALKLLLEARKEINRQRMERVLSVVRELTIIVESFIKD